MRDRSKHIEHLEWAGWFKSWNNIGNRKKEMLMAEIKSMKAKGKSSEITRKVKGGSKY